LFTLFRPDRPPVRRGRRTRYAGPPASTRKPMERRDFSGEAMSCRIASKTPLNCASYRFSSSSSRRARSRLVATSSRSRTKARMISMFTRAAGGLRSTLDSIATPCSVKALGSARVPPHLDLPKWNLKSLNSASVSRSMKSSGKRSRFRLTALFKLPVVTP